MRNGLWVLFLLTFATAGLTQDVSSYFMDSIWQRNHINPSFGTSTKWSIGLPAFYLGVQHPSLSLGDALRETSDGYELNFRDVIDQLDKENTLDVSSGLETFHVSLRTGSMTWSLHHALRLRSSLIYSRQLAELLAFGNEQFIGQSVDIGPELSFLSYGEIGLGGRLRLDNISIGARVKWLNGIQHIGTGSNKLELLTREEFYQLRFTTDYVVQSTSYLNLDELRDITIDARYPSLSESFSRNPGLAFDFGLNFDITPRFNISGAWTDVGFIKWKENPVEYRSQGVVEYEGIDVFDVLDIDSLEFDDVLDSLYEILSF